MKNELKTGAAPSFVPSRRRAVTVSPESLTSAALLDPARSLPLAVSPRLGNVDLIGWAKANLAFIGANLLRHGAVLFRGFAVNRPEQFGAFVEAVSGDALPYRERTSPRTQVARNIYTSTDYPSDQSILPHNENSYAVAFPRKLYFWCETAPQQGGETPIGDTRRILAHIDPAVVEEFCRKGWMYVRNFSAQFGLTWQTAFQTDDRTWVEDYCRKSDIKFEWTTGGLRTVQVRPALACHPETGELVWFNHAAFFHVSSVEPALRARLQAEYDQNDLPNHTFYGDGSPIDDSVALHLRKAYASEMVAFAWQPGDILLIDNMLAAHARAPFAGTRRILVAMAELYSRSGDVAAPDQTRNRTN